MVAITCVTFGIVHPGHYYMPFACTLACPFHFRTSTRRAHARYEQTGADGDKKEKHSRHPRPRTPPNTTKEKVFASSLSLSVAEALEVKASPSSPPRPKAGQRRGPIVFPLCAPPCDEILFSAQGGTTSFLASFPVTLGLSAWRSFLLGGEGGYVYVYETVLDFPIDMDLRYVPKKRIASEEPATFFSPSLLTNLSGSLPPRPERQV